MSATPTPFARLANYINEAQNNVNVSVSQVASELDAEFNALVTTLTSLISRLAEIQRSDGALANSIVTAESLSLGLLNTIAGVSYTYAYNLFGATPGSIPYQSAPNTTSFTAAGASGNTLQSAGPSSPPIWVASLGTGSYVLSNSATLQTPIFVAPALGTPASGNLSNCTNYPAASLSGTLASNKGGTGQSGTWIDGAMLMGSGGVSVLNRLTAGTGISIVNAPGSVTISTTGAGTVSLAVNQTLIAGGALLGTTSETLVLTDGSDAYALALADVIVSGGASATGQLLSAGGA